MDWIGYADDLVLVFEDTDNLQKGLGTLNETFKRYHLTINVTKTKTMIFNYHYINDDGTTYPQAISTINNTTVENVTKFRYLGDGIKYDEPSNKDAEINLRKQIAENKSELSKKIPQSKYMNESENSEFHRPSVRSRLTYSCQTWNLTKRQVDRIDSTYTLMLRKMVNGGRRRKKETEWSFELSNDDLHRICGTEDVSNFTAQQQKQYLAHLVRQSNDTMTKRLLFNSNNACKPGRQSTLESRILCDEFISADEFCTRAVNREI